MEAFLEVYGTKALNFLYYKLKTGDWCKGNPIDLLSPALYKLKNKHFR